MHIAEKTDAVLVIVGLMVALGIGFIIGRKDAYEAGRRDGFRDGREAGIEAGKAWEREHKLPPHVSLPRETQFAVWRAGEVRPMKSRMDETYRENMELMRAAEAELPEKWEREPIEPFPLT